MKYLLLIFIFLSSYMVSAQPMSGTYTIGSSGYFNTINQAIDSLQAKGVGGPVVLNVLPGVYNESIIFDSIWGTSPYNTITLQAANGDSTSVVISHISNFVGQKTIYSKINYLIIKHLTVIMDVSTNIGEPIRISGDFTTISNCIIKSINKNVNTYGNLLIVDGSNNTLITNNYLSGYFNYGIYYFNSNTIGNNLTIENNTIENLQLNYGCYTLYLSSISNCQVKNNHFIEGSIRLYKTNGSSQFIGNKVIGGLKIFNLTTTSSNPFLLANNFIISPGWTPLHLEDNQYVNIYNNTFLDSGSLSIGTYTIRLKNSSNITFKNNIFSDKAYGVLFYLDQGNSNIISDYNDYYTNGYYGKTYTNSIPSSSLAAWKTLSGMEANSISINPGFYSTNDLHISNPAMNGTGVSLSSVTTDIDGEPRPPTPDIGADESNFSPIDAGMISVLYNSYNPDSVCGYIVHDSVYVRVKNYGTNTINFSNHPMTLNLSITGPVNTSHQLIVNTDSLLKDSIRDFLIAPVINMPTGGTYNLAATVSIAADSNSLNNQSTNYILTNYKIESIPYTQSFEGFNESPSSLNSSFVDFKEGWWRSSNYYINNNLITSFLVKKGAWYNPLTGPAYDHTTLNTNGKWISPATALAVSVNKAWTPCVNFSGVQHPMLSFWYHMFGPELTNDTLFVDVYDGNSWDLGIFYLKGQQQIAQQAPWLQATVDLQAYTNMQVIIRFRVKHSSSSSYPNAIVAIDDILIDEVPVFNLGNDTSICLGDAIQIGIAGQTGHTYEWRKAPQNTVIAISSTLNISQSGTYILKATNINGISGTDTINIGIHPLPTPDLGLDTTICDTASIVLTPSISYVSYLWQDSSTLSQFIVNSSTGGGVFWVKVEDQNHCYGIDSVMVTLDTCLSIDFYQRNNIFMEYYPNPAKDYFYLKSKNYYGKAQCILYNSTGQLVLQKEIVLEENTLVKISTQEQPKGVYYLQITSSEGRFSAKLVIN